MLSLCHCGPFNWFVNVSDIEQNEWANGPRIPLLYCIVYLYSAQLLALFNAQVSLQLGKVFSSDNGVSVSIMYSYMY